MKEERYINRRNFFKLSFLAGSAITTGGLGLATKAEAHTHSSEDSNATSGQSASSEPAKLVRGKMFFQRDVDFATLSAACQRIYPKDEVCGGAIELGVPYFIDNQLAAAYGFNAREYMQGPFRVGKPEYGYQSPLYRREIFLIGLQGLQGEAQRLYQKDFSDITPQQQDSILKDFEQNKVKLDGISAKEFFQLLRDMTIAGVLADPIYQGNLNMNGWIAMEYPGAQMGHLDKIASDTYVKTDPMGLSDM